MRILLVLAFLLTFSTFAHAEGEQKITIKEDGTISITEVPKSAAAPKAEPQQKRVSPAPVVAADPAPKAKPAPKPAAPKKKKEAAAPKKKTPQKAAKKKVVPPAPVPAPAPEIASPRPSVAPSAQRLGPNMTPDDAIRIALDVAPPSRSVHAYAVNYKGLHCYQVIFATEDGDRSVFIDRETGKVVQ